MAIARRPALVTSLALPVLLWAVLGPGVQAQEFGRVAETETNTAYYFYAQPGEATVQVYLWGAGRSGIYEVPDSTDLDRLLTMAGGVQRGERRENQKPPRITVRLYRPDQSREEPVVEARLQDLLRGTVDAPRLRESDIVLVEAIQPSQFTWKDGLSILSTAASVTLLTLRIIRFSN